MNKAVRFIFWAFLATLVLGVQSCFTTSQGVTPQPGMASKPVSIAPAKYAIFVDLERFQGTDGVLGVVDGEDEVYFLVTTEKFGHVEPDDKHRKESIPDGGGQWNLSNGNTRRDINVATSTLRPGQSAVISIVVMERDGGTTEQVQTALAGLLRQSEDPKARAAGEVVRILTNAGLYLTNTDDFIGEAIVRVVCDQGGKISGAWYPGDRAYQDDGPVKGDYSRRYRLNGDGSDYWITGIIR